MNAMPTKDLHRWNQDAESMEKQFKEAGYEVDLQFASNDINTQVSQIENMISQSRKNYVTFLRVKRKHVEKAACWPKIT